MEEIKLFKIKLNLQLFAESSGEKTESATPKRRSEARKKGQVAKSQDLPQVVTLLLGIIIINVFAGFFYEKITQEFVRSLSEINITKLSL